MPSSIKASDKCILEGTLKGGLYIKPRPSSYSASQIAHYLTRICYASTERTTLDFLKTGSGFEINLINLERLIRLHLLTFPQENTVLHYTSGRTPDSDPQRVFHRLMHERKGTLCAGQNVLFLHMLRGLGYRAYHVAARANSELVANPRRFSAIGHLVIFVQPQDSNLTYFVDVGSHIGPIRPILLSDSMKNLVSGASDTEKFRLRRFPDPRSSLESQKGDTNTTNSIWHLQVQRLKQRTQTAPWITFYAFSEEEFYERDIANGSFVSRFNLDANLLVHEVYAAKYVLLDEEGNPILDMNRAGTILSSTDVLKSNVGRVVLVGRKLKLIYGGNSKLVTIMETEKARIGVLKDVFGLIINDDEIGHIKGLPSWLDKDDFKSLPDHKPKL